MKKNFGAPKQSGYGRVIVGIDLRGKDDVDEMLAVINAAMRSGVRSDRIEKWRKEVMNMRARAYHQDWPGWE